MPVERASSIQGSFSEIERLLVGGVDSAVELSRGGVSNERMHKALLLAVRQLKQFQSNEKELNDKVRALEALMRDSMPLGSSIGAGHSCFEGTSKFGTGSLRLDSKLDVSDNKQSMPGLVQTAAMHSSHDHGSGGGTFIDLVMNSSKIEPHALENSQQSEHNEFSAIDEPAKEGRAQKEYQKSPHMDDKDFTLKYLQSQEHEVGGDILNL